MGKLLLFVRDGVSRRVDSWGRWLWAQRRNNKHQRHTVLPLSKEEARKQRELTYSARTPVANAEEPTPASIFTPSERKRLRDIARRAVGLDDPDVET